MAQSSRTSKQTGQAGGTKDSGQLLYDLLEKILKEQERILTQQDGQLGGSHDQEQRLLRKVDTLSKKLQEPVAEVQNLKASLISGLQSCCSSKSATSLSGVWGGGGGGVYMEDFIPG